MSTTKKVLKNSSIYGTVSILQKAIGFFLLPLYTSYLSPTDYGITGVVGSVVSFLSLLYILSLNGSVTRFYYEYKSDEDKVKELWGTIMTFIVLNSIVFSSIFLIFHKYLLDPFAKGIAFYPYMFLGVITVTLSPSYSIFQATLQARQIGKKYGLNNLLFFIINLVLTIVFVVVFKFKAAGVLLAGAITNGIFFIYTLIDFFPHIKLRLNIKYMSESLRYSLPLLPHSLSGWIMTMLDRIFLNNMKTAATVGIYNIGFQFGNILNIVTTAVNQAYVPWFFENMKEGEEGRNRIIKFAEYSILIYGFAAMSISLFGKDILSFMVTSQFREGWVVIPFISFAYVFNGIYYFFVNPLFYNKKGTKYIPIGTFSSAVINSILNAVLIPPYGIIGASIASMISMVLSSVIMLFISAKIEYVEFNWRRIYTTTFIFFAFSLICFAGDYFNSTVFLLIKLAVVAVIIMIIYLLYKKESKYFIDFIISKTRRRK